MNTVEMAVTTRMMQMRMPARDPSILYNHPDVATLRRTAGRSGARGLTQLRAT